MKFSKKNSSKKNIRKSKKCNYGGSTGQVVQQPIDSLKKYLLSQLKIESTLETALASTPPCITPNSKGGQVINICPNFVYKTPPAGAVPQIQINWNIIRVDSYTMNLLIQTLVKNDTDLNTKVECYDHLENSTHFSQQGNFFAHLVGNKYEFVMNGEKCFSVENFIEKVLNKATDQQIKQKCIDILFNWIKTMISTLDLLCDKLQ